MLRDPWSLDPQDFMIIRSALHIVLAAMVLAPAAAAQSNPSGGSVVAFRVGDAIRVQVWRNPELSGTYEIGEDGTVLHPLYRSIRVAGLSLPEAEDEFRQLLQRFEQEPEFVIEPVFRIGIGGEVRSPNVYTVTALTTVMQAVAMAGGPTPNARLNRVRLLRDGTALEVDITRPDALGADRRVRSGDQIILEPRRNVWRSVLSPTLSAIGSAASFTYVVLRVTRVL
jgi:polysaccharide biosynthesis/export protein